MNVNESISTIMTSDIQCVSPEQKLIDLKHIYEQLRFHSHVPVVQNNELIGMVSLIDFMRAIENASLDDTEEVYHRLCVKDIMSTHPVTIDISSSIKDAAKLLSDGSFHALPVVSQNNVKGIITTTDLLKYLIGE